jgi:hypothetical protein
MTKDNVREEFEKWFKERQVRTWNPNIDKNRPTHPDNWGMGLKGYFLEGWQAAYAAGLAARNDCGWRVDEEGTWNTDCDNLFVIIEGTPQENDMRFCPYCGGSLVEHGAPTDQ